MADLTAKQQRFTEEYPVDLNATQAAIRAGYSQKTAEAQGCRLLSNVKVKALVDKALQDRSDRTKVTQDMVLEELAKIGFANMDDYIRTTDDGDPYVDLSGLTRDQAAAISEITIEDFKDGRGEGARDVRKVKFKLLDKRAALVDVGKHLGMFVERKTITLADADPNEVSASTRLKEFLDGVAKRS